MELLASLSSLLKVDLSKLKSIELHFFCGNTKNTTQVVDKSVNINIANFDDKDKAKLKGIIKSSVVQEGELILRDDTKKLLEEFETEDGKEENKEILQWFKGKIPANDYEALRASFFVSYKFKKGEDVRQLRWDIIRRYGERGKNISNLCTAGYFTSQIKPLYEEMFSQPDFNSNKFLERYEIIVTESPYAVFISKPMTKQEAKEEVLGRIAIGKKYGIHALNIHGLGSDNLEKIRIIISELQAEFTQPSSALTHGNSITVKVQF